MAKSFDEMNRSAIKLGMIMYWILLAVGIGVIIVGAVVPNLFLLIYVGLVIPGVFGLINSFRNISETLGDASFMGKILLVMLTIMQWVFLGIIFGLINAIKYTKAFVRLKKENYDD